MNRTWAFRFLLFACFLTGALYPFFGDTGGKLTLLEEVFAFGAFAMAYDILLGYTGIVSFGHAMFFGTGAYAVGIFMNQENATSVNFWEGIGAAVVIGIVLSIVISMLSLRIRDTYFAMITLAVGQTFFILAGSHALRPLTNANDGMTVNLPEWLDGDLPIYYLAFGFLVLTAIVLGRFVHSPIGDVLKGIRENESRVLALGHSAFRFKMMAFIVSGVFSSLAGAVYAVVQMFVSTQVYDVSTSLNVLLMVIIGGAGTLYGGLIGALIILYAQSEFGNLAGTYPFLNHYMIVFGVMYILIVRFLPNGILGTLLSWRGRVSWKTSVPSSRRSQI
jgi:branched-chain amino acid transport system permease protein